MENNRLQWDVFGKQRLVSCAIFPSCFLFPGSLRLLLFQLHEHLSFHDALQKFKRHEYGDFYQNSKFHKAFYKNYWKIKDATMFLCDILFCHVHSLG